MSIAYNTFIQIIGKIFSLLLSFISISLLTRYLGQAGFGNYTLVIAYLSIFGIMGDLGLQLTMVRELAKKENQTTRIYGSYFYLKSILIIFSSFLAIILLPLFPYTRFLKLGIVIASLGTGLGVLNYFGTTIFQSKVRLDLVTLVDTISKTVTVIFIVFFVYLKLGFYSILYTILIGNFVQSGIIILILKKVFNIKFIYDSKVTIILLRKTLPVALITLIAYLYFKIDTLILSFYRSSSEVGIYGLAYKVIENLLVIWGFYMASIYPVLSIKFNYKLWKNSLFIAILSSIMMIILLTIFSPLIIRILGGSQFYNSILVLKILSFSLPFFYVNNLFYHTFLVKSKTKSMIKVLFIGLLFNIMVNLIFIPKFGYIAAAINTILTEILLCLIYYYEYSSC